jgi:2-hydroxychromene-2-carboxylate isomerase
MQGTAEGYEHMRKQIELFYTYSSPYSYLLVERMYELEKMYDVHVEWQPLVPSAEGDKNREMEPERLRYMIRDVQRIAESLNLPIVFPPRQYDPLLPLSGALVAKEMGVLFEYNIKLFHHWWGEGLDPNEGDYFAALAEELDVDVGQFLEQMNSHEVREHLQGISHRAKRLGVFGVPMTVVEDELFWGQDRIGFVSRKLTQLGLKR